MRYTQIHWRLHGIFGLRKAIRRAIDSHERESNAKNEKESRFRTFPTQMMKLTVSLIFRIHQLLTPIAARI